MLVNIKTAIERLKERFKFLGPISESRDYESALQLAIMELQALLEESTWHDPEKEPPPIGEEVLIIARTENYDAGKLLAMFDPDCGWILTDAEYEWFEVRAWMAIPEWKGWAVK